MTLTQLVTPLVWIAFAAALVWFAAHFAPGAAADPPRYDQERPSGSGVTFPGGPARSPIESDGAA